MPYKKHKLGRSPMQLNGYIIDHQSDLSGANLSGLEIVNADITQATLAGANLAGSKIVNVQSRGACFERANLVKADLVGEDLEGVDFSHTDLTDADLSEANLKGANFMHAKLHRVKFRNANLAGACFDYSAIDESDFSYAEFHGYFEHPESKSLGMEGTALKFSRTRFSNSKFIGSNFACNCNRAENAFGYKSCSLAVVENINRCDFSGANLSGLEIQVLSAHTSTPFGKLQNANLQDSVINLHPWQRPPEIGETYVPRTKGWDDQQFMGANLTNAKIMNLRITTLDDPRRKVYVGAKVSGIEFVNSYLFKVDDWRGKIMEIFPLSEFDDSKIHRILGC